MNIYADTYLPYTYLIGWSDKITGLGYETKYIGSKYGNDANPVTFWKDYFTSSDEVKLFREQYGDPDRVEIRKTFPRISREDAPNIVVKYETRMLTSVDAKNNKQYLNKSNGGKTFFHINSGLASVKDIDGNTMQVSVDDPRYKSGELKHINDGMVTVRDATGKIVKITEQEYHDNSDDYVGIAKGFVPVKDKLGNTYHVAKDDPRLLSGELFHPFTGLVVVKDSEGKTFSVSKDDPRFISGELRGSMADTVTVVDVNGNKLRVSKDDPRYVSGELKGVNIGKKMFNNGIIEKLFSSSDKIPVGFVLGGMKRKR